MNLGFLIVVAVPLGAYLLVLLFSMRDVGTGEAEAEHTHAPAEIGTVETVHEPLLEVETVPVAFAVGADTLVATETVDSVADVAVVMPNAVENSTDEIAATVVPGTAQVSTETVVSEAAAATETLSISTPIAAAESAAIPEQSETKDETPVADAELPAKVEAAPTATKESAAKPVVATPVPPEELVPEEADPILPEGPIVLPDKGSPKYAFDYRGRLWVEKKNKGFFRQLRRPQLPAEDPTNNSGR